METDWVEEARDITCSLLKRPGQPDACIFFLIARMKRVQHLPEGWQEDPRLRGWVWAIYNAGLRWITFTRTLEQLRTLRHAMNDSCTCSAAERSDLLHATAASSTVLDAPGVGDPFMFLLFVALEPFSHYWDDDAEVAFRTPSCATRRLAKLGRRPGHRWPRASADMFPHGPEHTFRALANLLRLDPLAGVRRCIYEAMNTMIALGLPLIAPSVATSRTFVVHGIVAAVVVDEEAMRRQYDGDNARERDIAIREALYSLAVLLDTCIASLNESQLTLLYQQAAPELIGTLDRCARLACALEQRIPPSRRDIYTTTKLLGRTGGRLYDYVPSTEHTPISSWARTLFSAHALSKGHAGHGWTASRVLYALHHLSLRDRCAAPGCPRTSADSRLKRCGRCKRVLYCSRTCQRAA
jgi:hypothetical protein